MRPLLLLTLSLALAACIREADPAPLTLRPTTSDPDSLLARLDVNELTEAFERLEATGYTAEIMVHELAASSSGRAFGQIIEVSGDSIRILEPSGEASLDDGFEPFPLFDPVARLLPKEPPFRNPATREMYTLTRGTREGPVARATAERREGTDPILGADVAVDTTTGQVVWAQVSRESRSAVFDESSQATIELTMRDGAWWPASGQLITDIDVPLSDAPRRQLEWRVLSIGGVPLTADTGSTASLATD